MSPLSQVTLPPLIFRFLMLAQRVHALEEVLSSPPAAHRAFLCWFQRAILFVFNAGSCCVPFDLRSRRQAGQTGHQVSLDKLLRK